MTPRAQLSYDSNTRTIEQKSTTRKQYLKWPYEKWYRFLKRKWKKISKEIEKETKENWDEINKFLKEWKEIQDKKHKLMKKTVQDLKMEIE